MKAGTLEKRNITPEQAIKILQKNGIEVNEKQAEEILELLFILAKLEVQNYLNS